MLVLSRQGRLLSSGALPRGQVLDAVIATQRRPRGVRLGTSAGGGSTVRTLWTLRPGARQATRLGTFVRPPTCAGYGPGGFSGRFLLLQVPTGTVRVFDTARPGRSVDLTPLSRALERRHRTGIAGWLARWRRA